ncbi:hypothetical protein NDU88_003793 [Pleurodeles waltl]|uniref:Uncharacterized protein n=1 Tax=Pleurodeles waltl TaxID=8319 RepID=A0AAV7WQ20_PLEWA|nr:hypothetical protein NDU88_003793 [Pleurodeles waltl]
MRALHCATEESGGQNRGLRPQVRGGLSPGDAPPLAMNLGGAGRPEDVPAHSCPPHLPPSYTPWIAARRKHRPGRRARALPEETGESKGSTRGPRRAGKPQPRLVSWEIRSRRRALSFCKPSGGGRPGTPPPALKSLTAQL